MIPNDLADDCAMFDGAQTVTLTLQRPDGATALAVAGALKRRSARGEAEFGGVALSGEEAVWHVPDAPLAGLALLPGDTISAAGEVWAIVTAEKTTLGTRWRCVCRKQL